MTWVDAILFLALVLGLAAGGFMVARSPTFWIGFAVEVFKRILPVLAKRNTPEIEAEMQACLRRGGEWDNARKRCRQK